MTLKTAKLIALVLDFILPRSPEVKKLESLDAKQLKKIVSETRLGSTFYNHAHFIFDYSHPLVRLAIWELKYRGNKKVAKILADCLSEKIFQITEESKDFPPSQKPLIIPIPISKERRKERGFNQCELLISNLLKIDREKNFETSNNLLVKIKNTASQTENSRSERLENLSGCFKILNKDKISNQTIILIDDVTTTGATFDEAKKTLLGAGAKKIILLAVAH